MIFIKFYLFHLFRIIISFYNKRQLLFIFKFLIRTNSQTKFEIKRLN